MGAPRNPSYPNISLAEAISKARQIYQKEHMSTMTPAVVAEGMGYNGVNGASLKAIASLKKYGLLEGRADGLRLTKDAQTLAIDDAASGDYRDALARSALAPEVFREIIKQFPGPASDRNITVYLQKQGFMPDAATLVAKFYKDSLTLVSGNPATYGGGREDDDTLEATTLTNLQSDSPPGRAFAAPPIPHQAVPSPITPGLPRVVQDGKLLQITATVDLKGLRKLKLMLDNYEKLLVMIDAEDEFAALDITQETGQ